MEDRMKQEESTDVRSIINDQEIDIQEPEVQAVDEQLPSDSSVDGQGCIEMENEESEEPQSQTPLELLEELKQKKELIRKLIDEANGEEGEYWYLIPQTFYNDLMNTEAASVEEMKNQLGKMNMESIVDAYGNLYNNEDENTSTKAIPPDAFNILADWFGMDGKAPTRALIIENGIKQIERFPPIFIIHNLTSKTTRQQMSYSSNANKTKYFQFSQTQTFEGLYQMVKMNNFKSQTKPQFRIWMIGGLQNMEMLPNSITIKQFINDIPMKKLIGRNILKQTLKLNQIVASNYHLLIENFDDSLNKFPITGYLEGFEFHNSQISNKSTGKLGLINLGNTCYMNSALQCLVHIPELNNYFFYGVFERELNESNPLGFHGNMAKVFASLINRLFNDNADNGHSSAISPREFKNTIGQYSSMFHGYLQQDSQEFISWLLDSLHEDLNRIINKPYLEKPELKDDEIDDPLAIANLARICWDQYKQRNDSVIVDLFSGLYQSILVCPDCNKTSITYDPFNDLTLPLPINKKWYHTFTVINLDFSQDLPSEQRIMKLEVELSKTSVFEDLLVYLSTFLKLPKTDLFVYEIFNEYFYQDFQSNSHKYKFMPISEVISKSDDVLIYIIPNRDDDLIIPVLNTVPELDSSYNMSSVFGYPLFITVPEKDVTSFGKIRGKLEQAVQVLTKVDINQHYRDLKKLPCKQYYTKDDFDIETNEPETDSPVVIDPESPVIVSKGEESEGEQIEDIVDGYDSDISLADPEISGDYGFTIKYNRDMRLKLNKRVHVPLVKPNFNKLPKLSDLLPELKYKYYHYPNYKEYISINSEKGLDEPVGVVEEGNENGDDIEEEEEEEDDEEEPRSNIILPDRQAMATPSTEDVEPPLGASETGEIESNSGSEETDGSEEPMGSLFDSVDLSRPPFKSQQVVQSSEGEKNLNKSKHPEFLTRETMLVCEWDREIYQELFEANKTWTNLKNIPNPELEANREKLRKKEKSTISLYDCLDNFNQPEVLGDQDLWYCPRCKDHKQATKTIKIWSTGDILTIHLKRFQVARSFSDKIDITIDFPIEGLDMTKYIGNENQEVIYDLIGVDNHFGGLGGGHYTSSVYNFKDQNWYYFNDSHVSKIDNPTDMINGSAYLLFYRKRSDNVGSERLNVMIDENKTSIREKLVHVYEEVNMFEEQNMETLNKKSKTEDNSEKEE
ncbi:ubiquitin carboxyl-terminal hydrolase 12 [[Candida] jaroonii]|uniref:Ubiquitin carboxyl-terminal hydrolase 12 n=1 Tax=[Candida] jaroonii TaxID=467808 RepID=A0ACA9Y1Q0_9ASCO|nr:ubiquitin carboxyl-terminal hydrolase 12 [[Candida] jaroonii]